MVSELLNDGRDRMSKAVNQLKGELATLRAGRATPSLLDKVMVDYYGTPTSVFLLANMSAPEPRLLVV